MLQTQPKLHHTSDTRSSFSCAGEGRLRTLSVANRSLSVANRIRRQSNCPAVVSIRIRPSPIELPVANRIALPLCRFEFVRRQSICPASVSIPIRQFRNCGASALVLTIWFGQCLPSAFINETAATRISKAFGHARTEASPSCKSPATDHTSVSESKARAQHNQLTDSCRQHNTTTKSATRHQSQETDHASVSDRKAKAQHRKLTDR